MLSWLKSFIMPTVDPLQELQAENNRLRTQLEEQKLLTQKLQLEKVPTPEQAANERYRMLIADLERRENTDSEENIVELLEGLLNNLIRLTAIGPIAFSLTDNITNTVRMALTEQAKFTVLRKLYRELKRDQIRYECFSLPKPDNLMSKIDEVRDDLTTTAEDMLETVEPLAPLLELLDRSSDEDLASNPTLILMYQMLDLALPEKFFHEDMAPGPAVVYVRPDPADEQEPARDEQDLGEEELAEDEQELNLPRLRG